MADENFTIFGIALIIFTVIAVQWLLTRPRSFRHRSDPRFKQSKLVSVLLGLNDRSVGELMELYNKEFGPGPARYARRTFNKWRTGKVQPATQTYERFLVHLPKVMSFDLKCEVLRHFMEEYAAKDIYELDVYTDDWEEKLTPLVRQIIDKAFTAQLPIEVERKLKWLGDGDMEAAHEILRRSKAEEGRIMVSMLRDEFLLFEELPANDTFKPTIRHDLKFPYGTIEMNIRRR